ncbi:unnamed protein product [Rhizoctonia solani]|uniref:Protein kinase domain-containing protein n=1 Tax=Rhizoctonia solani TaxID=456999 RepID=A0A8H2WZ22_9AGAM|nr:unnamed protein product [Rhizoctonia solani]
MNSNKDSASLVSGGGFSDIWRGGLLDGTRVAIIKTWREVPITTGEYKTLKRAAREIHIWSKIKHENVHKLMGIVMFKGQSIGMVSEWMENGNLHEYIRKNPNADRFKLCTQVVSGIAYIHDLNMVHGDIKACRWDFNVSMRVSQGIFPTRPASHIKDDQRGNRTWGVLVGYWQRKPEARP